MLFHLCILFASLAPQAAQAQYMKMAGIPLARCAEPDCGGLVVRTVPWHIQQYRRLVGKPDADRDPYVQLSVQNATALKKFAATLSAPNVAKFSAAVFGAVEMEFYPSEANWSRPISFSDLRTEYGRLNCSNKTHSMTIEEDQAEQYGLIELDCLGAASNRVHTSGLVGVALKSGRIVRAYFGVPREVWASVPAKEPR